MAQRVIIVFMPNDLCDPDFQFCSNKTVCSVEGSQPTNKINEWIINKCQINQLINLTSPTEDRGANNTTSFLASPPIRPPVLTLVTYWCQKFWLWRHRTLVRPYVSTDLEGGSGGDNSWAGNEIGQPSLFLARNLTINWAWLRNDISVTINR